MFDLLGVWWSESWLEDWGKDQGRKGEGAGALAEYLNIKT